MKRHTKKALVQNLLSFLVVSGITTIASLSRTNAAPHSAAAGKQQQNVNNSIRCCKVIRDENGNFSRISCTIYNVRSSCPEGSYQAIERKPSYLGYSNPRSPKSGKS